MGNHELLYILNLLSHTWLKSIEEMKNLSAGLVQVYLMKEKMKNEKEKNLKFVHLLLAVQTNSSLLLESLKKLDEYLKNEQEKN